LSAIKLTGTHWAIKKFMMELAVTMRDPIPGTLCIFYTIYTDNF